MINTSQVEGLENQLKDAKDQVERGKIAFRLASNRDFRKLIMEGFCKEDAARFAAQAGDPALDPQQRSDAMNMAMAGGHLKRFLQAQIQMGATAERELNDLELELEDARAEAETPAETTSDEQD